MSSTYVSGYRAVALRGTAGYAYLMFYETCESNVVPRHPKWWAPYVGNVAEIGAQVVEHIYCCEDGLTRGYQGRALSPERHIERSEQALRDAGLFVGEVRLTFGSHYTQIPRALCAEFDAAVSEAGIQLAEHTDRDGESLRSLSMSEPANVDFILKFQKEHPEKVRAGDLIKGHDISMTPERDRPWTPPLATKQELSRAAHDAATFLAAHSVLKLKRVDRSQAWPLEQVVVLDEQQRILSGNPMDWFCGGYMQQHGIVPLGCSLACMKVFRHWVRDSMQILDAAQCELEATLRGEADDHARRIATDLSGGTCSTLPTRGSAANAMGHLRWTGPVHLRMARPNLNMNPCLI